MISFQDYVTASGRFLDRLDSEELTDEVKTNAEELLSRVNAALEYVEHEDAEISSGFRPSAVNRTTANAATKSTHARLWSFINKLEAYLGLPLSL